ncbi:MAG: CoA transferase [Bacteroidetes bacterium]|nr:CoA transferase [Bacteroidota bacterium]
MSELNGPLKGIKILDLTRLLPGPLATQYLADLGAEVIKIEDVDFPDYTRFFPPHLGSESIHYLSVNRSKKSLAIKLGSEEGKAVFFDMVRLADVVIEGFRPGMLDKLGLGYEHAKAQKSDIIYVSISGYGQDGPLSHKAGHDLNYVGYAGIMAVNGKDGESMMPGVQIADIMGGSYNAVIGCMSALFERMRTGKGQHVDVSMTDGAMQIVTMPLGESMNLNNHHKPGEFMLSGGLANYNSYACADGKYIALGALEPKFWTGFCKLIGKPEWFNEAFSGPEKTAQLKISLAELFKTRTRDEWIKMAEDADICLSPVLSLEELEVHEHFEARNMIVEHEHPSYGKLKGTNQPIKFSVSKLHKGWAPPLLGEHSVEVLRAYGFSEQKIKELNVGKVIKQA